MNNSKNLSQHYLALAGVIALGTTLRFWHLDIKPLWLDEVLTALFSSGRSYQDVPLEVVFPLSTLQHLFALQPDISYSEIAQTVATQSTHPPLFFCLMHQWLSWVEPVAQSLSWKLRSLPALFGVGAIATLYYLNRVAFSRKAGLMGAALMAVSPFGVYLSQEARHYTLPMLLIILALVGLIQIQQDLFHRQQLPRLAVLLGWVVVNSIGLYVHYFFILAFIAQLITLIVLLCRGYRLLPHGSIIAIGLTVLSVALSYLPWLPVLLGHMGRSETDWLPPPQNVAPVFQTLSSWLTMVIILPIEALLPAEGRPSVIQILGVLLMVLMMLGFGIWVAWQSFRGLKQLWRSPITHLATFTLTSYTFWVLLEFFGIVYILGKDITVGFRYNFVYYPALYALLGASLVSRSLPSELRSQESGVRSQASVVGANGRLLLTHHATQTPLQGSGVRRQKGFFSVIQRLSKLKKRLEPSSFQTCCIIVLVGILSCVFVVSDLAFQKSFNPQNVARDMNFDPTLPLMIVMGYQDSQDVALGLSFALALDPMRRVTGNPLTSSNPLGETTDTYFTFLNRSTGYEPVWEKLSELPMLPMPRLNLWVIAPGLKRRDYPQQLAIANQTSCRIDPTQHHRIGIPYQLYQCNTSL